MSSLIEVLFVRLCREYPSVFSSFFCLDQFICQSSVALIALTRILRQVMRGNAEILRCFCDTLNLLFKQAIIVSYWLDSACLLTGRFLLGVYFILPGISKIVGYEPTAVYMAEHNVPFVDLVLPLTIVLQIGLGVTLIIGLKGKLTAFLLAGMTFVISLYMHNFWDYAEGLERNHETQNFFKNMGIMAGLLCVAALGTGRFSLDNKLAGKAAH